MLEPAVKRWDSLWRVLRVRRSHFDGRWVTTVHFVK